MARTLFATTGPKKLETMKSGKILRSSGTEYTKIKKKNFFFTGTFASHTELLLHKNRNRLETRF